ncbi:hypothetical protein SCHPADRAFT_662166 [Schizopora paradoxa]|uniref:Uncharacterized protein n=1 Tax=Schizopora paradoxa TaxID=27342 RepID=A0A0H2R5T1_9AGAM|nr:hypothetical protein SCHPADRAFT_662166 [Schizopora paradoxa]
MFELPVVDGTCGGTSAGMRPELYEGLPLVTLAGDKGTDVEHLLRAAYERQYYYRDDDATKLEIFVVLLRMRTKYDFKHIRRDLIKQAAKFYPMDQIGFELALCLGGKIFDLDRGECPFALLKVMFETNVDVMLPILYYSCCPFYMDHILTETQTLPSEGLRTLLIGKKSSILA